MICCLGLVAAVLALSMPKILDLHEMGHLTEQPGWLDSRTKRLSTAACISWLEPLAVARMCLLKSKGLVQSDSWVCM